jgi:hypothetical protein
MRTAQFSLRTMFLWFTIVALWLGALQSVRFAQLQPGFVAILAALGTCYWFRRSVPIGIWLLAVIAAIYVLIAILMPSIP